MQFKVIILTILFVFVSQNDMMAQNPGGVAGARVWLDASSGASTTSWTDRTGNAFNPSGSGAQIQTTNVSNFNSQIYFPKGKYFRFPSTKRMFTAANDMRNAKIFVVSTPINGSNNRVMGWYANNSHNGGFQLNYNQDKRAYFDNPYGYRVSASLSSFSSIAHGLGAYGSSNMLSMGEMTNTNQRFYVGGKIVAQVKRNHRDFFSTNPSYEYVGAKKGAGTGNIKVSEIIVYPNAAAMTTNQITQIETYLSIKYGLTRSQDAPVKNYLASNGSVIFDGSTVNAYRLDVAAIGRDDASGLNQKQSQSCYTGDGVRPIVGLGSIQSTNGANTNSFSADRSFMFIGTNRASDKFDQSITQGVPPAAVAVFPEYSRMSRVWRVKETGTVGTVEVAFNTPNNSYIVVSSDPTFSSGNTWYTTTLKSVNGTNYKVANINLADGQYFTVAAPAPSPGGVYSGTTRGWKFDVYYATYTNANQFGTGTANTTPTATGYTGYPSANDVIDSRNDKYGIEYNGTLEIPTTGSYTFTLNGDNQAMLWIDGVLRLTSTYPTPVSLAISLTAGDHAIRVKHYEGTGSQYCRLTFTGPGIVANTRIDGRYVRTPSRLSTWYKGDNLVISGSSVARFINMSPNSKGNGDLFRRASAGRTGDYYAHQSNYNRVVQFDGDEYFSPASNVNGLVTYNGTADMFSILAPYSAANAGTSGWIFGQGKNTANQGWGHYQGNSTTIGAAIAGNSVPATQFNFTRQALKYQIVYGSRSMANTTWTYQSQLVAQNNLSSGVNGTETLATELTNMDIWNLTRLYIGAISGAGNQYLGRYAEGIYYPFNLNTIQRRKVNSYLAIKYGVQIPPSVNYISPDSVVVWNSAIDTAYNYYRFGIARDDADELYQRQSKNCSDYMDWVRVSKGAIATTNLANTGAMDDGTYLMFGSNNQSISPSNLQTTEIPAYLGSEGCGFQRFRVEYMVQQTSNVGPVNLYIGDGWNAKTNNIPRSAKASAILWVSNKSNFADPTAVITAYKVKSYGTDKVALFEDVQFPAGVSYFTIGWPQTAPGGVSSSLRFWVKADDGSTGSMTTWTDLSTSAASMTASSDPAIAVNSLNFNPTVFFDGGDFFQTTNTFNTAFTSAEVFSVGKTNRTNANQGAMFDFGGHRGMHYTWGDATIYEGFGTSDRYGFRPATSVVVEAKAGMSAPAFTFDPLKYSFINVYTGAGQWGYRVRGRLLSSTSTNTVNWARASYAYVYIGASAGYGNFLGNVGEVILHNTILSATDRAKVNSYLAIKYGLGIDQTTPANYLASDGTVIWSATLNNKGALGNFNQNIFGVGRDDCSDLAQLQSKSEDAGDHFSISVGDFTTTNEENDANIDSNRNFVILSNNGGSLSIANAVADNTIVDYAANSCNTRRYQRLWRMSVTGSSISDIQIKVGNTANKVTGGMRNPALAIDRDGDGDFSTGLVDIIYADAVSSGVATFGGVDVADGAIVAFVWTASAPGGVDVSSLKLWLDAGELNDQADASEVSQWNDYSTAGLAFNQSTAGSLPLCYLRTTNRLVNYNPVLEFDGTNDHLLNTSFPNHSYTAGLSTFGVFSFNNTTQTSSRIYDFGNGATNNNIILSKSGTTANYALNVLNGATSSNSISTGTFTTGKYAVFGATVAGGTAGTLVATAMYINGLATAASPNTNVAQAVTRTINYIGRSNVGTNSYLNGKISEVIQYNRLLTATERLKVNSYLAMKYGFTLDQTTPQNYLSSKDSIVWSASRALVGSNNFNKDIRVIGRDDCSGLDQRQSSGVFTNTDGNDIIAIGQGSIEAGNVDNPNLFPTDHSFMTWAHNGATVALGSPSTNIPASISSLAICYQRTQRVWQVQKNQEDVDAVQIRAGATGRITFTSSMRPIIIVNSAAQGATNFASATRFFYPTRYLKGVAIFDTVSFEDGDYFTIAYAKPGPGGVSSGLAAWYSADVEAYSDDLADNLAVDGDGVANVFDRSSSGYTISQATASQRPILRDTTASKLINFNSVLDFTRAQSHHLATPYQATMNGDISAYSIGTCTGNATTNYAPFGARVATSGATRGWTMYWDNTGQFELWSATGNASNWAIVSGGVATYNRPVIASAILNLGTGSKTLFADGLQLATGTGNYVSNTTKAYTMGANGDPAEYWQGTIAEQFVYNRTNLSASELKQINSYVSIKYGNTLDVSVGNYANSLGQNIYNYTSHWNRITGIGRDDCSGLEQRQSISGETGAMITISTDTIEQFGKPGYTTVGLAINNTDNQVPFATNMNYQVLGDDNGLLKWSPLDMPSSPNLQRLYRTWRVAETGDIGKVYIDVPGPLSSAINKLPPTEGDVYLVVASASTNGVFSSTTGVTKIPMTYDEVSQRFYAYHNFNNGDYFSFATIRYCIACAGENASLTTWYRPESLADTSVVATTGFWKDELNTHTLTRTSTGTAVFHDGSTDTFNYNPHVILSGNATFEKSALSNTAITQTTVGTIFGIASVANNQFGLSRSSYNASILNGAGGAWANITPITSGTFTANIPNITFLNKRATTVRAGVNGSLVSAANSTALPVSATHQLSIGSVFSGATEVFNNGKFAEAVTFNDTLADTTLLRINAYFAVKYGRSLPYNYLVLDPTGTKNLVAYNISAYPNRITGIGVDSTNCLIQKQSKSVESGNLIVLNIDGSIAPSNGTNVADFVSDRSYVIAGDNGNPIDSFRSTWTLPGYERPATYIEDICMPKRLSREWKVTATGDDMNFSIHIFSDSSSRSVKLPAIPQSPKKYKLVLVMNDVSDFSVDANQEVFDCSYNADSKTWDATVSIPANTTRYFTYVIGLEKCGLRCIRTNQSTSTSRQGE